MKRKKSILITFALISIAFSSCKTSALNDDSKSIEFSALQLQMINSGDNTDPMRVFKISNYEDSLQLRKTSQDVNPAIQSDTRELFIDRLYATVRDSMSLGVGIAAPQVGILKNIIWVQRFDKEGFPFEVYLNPEIKQYSKMKQTYREGCLSIPGRSDTLNCRAYAILLEYWDREGVKHIELIEDFTAVIFQHEIDHLRGMLYIDHVLSESE